MSEKNHNNDMNDNREIRKIRKTFTLSSMSFSLSVRNRKAEMITVFLWFNKSYLN